LARTDLWFLLRYLLNRPDIEHDWLYDRVRDVEREPNGRLDLWARGHYKSTIITFAKTIQDILASHGDEPLDTWGGIEPCFVIFSHTRPIAKAFLRQIKFELERNEDLIELFPDILWERPDSQAPKWSEDFGIVVQRHSNPKEATVEAWGLVDGQPTSKHFQVLIYDDVVTRASVTGPDMIRKTTESWELSLNLGSIETTKRYIGTRYHWADTYREMMKREAAVPRLYPGTEDGTLRGKPVFLNQEQWDEKVREMGPVTASAQLLQNPTQDASDSFKRSWVQKVPRLKPDQWRRANRYILVDPASEKKKNSDYTAMAVLGLGADRNFYLLDAIRDRLNLAERTQMLFELHRRYDRPKVGYEKYGMQADIEHIKHVQNEQNYRFAIEELGGQVAKLDRIKRLIPVFAEGRFYFPDDLWYTPYDGKPVDLVQQIIEEELLPFPVPVHEDAIDAISRIFDMPLVWPKPIPATRRERYSERRTRSYMSA
jgi:predicted phage terminase large subunit-like protein